MAKELGYAFEIKLAGEVAAYTNTNIGVVNGVMRLHSGRGNLTLSSNTYYPDLVTDIGVIESTVDYYELGGYRPFVQASFSIVDIGLIEELKTNSAYLKNAETTIYIGLDGVYTAECVGVITDASDEGDRVNIVVSDLSITRESFTDILTVGNFINTAKMSLKEVKDAKARRPYVGTTNTTGDLIDADSPDALMPVLEYDESLNLIELGYENSTFIAGNPNYSTYLEYLEELFGDGDYVIEKVSGDDAKAFLCFGALDLGASGYEVEFLFKKENTVFEPAVLSGLKLTTLGDFVRVTAPTVQYYLSNNRALGAYYLEQYSDSDGDFDKTFSYGFKTRVGSKRGGRYNFDGFGRRVEFPQYTLNSATMTSAVISINSTTPLPFTQSSFDTTVPRASSRFVAEIVQSSSTVAKNTLNLSFSVPASYFEKKGGLITPVFAFKLENGSATNQILFDTTEPFIGSAVSLLTYNDGTNNYYYEWSSFSRSSFVIVLDGNDQYLLVNGSERDGATSSLNNTKDCDLSFSVDKKILNASDDISFLFSIPITNDGSSFDLGEFGISYFGFETEYGNIQEIPATAIGETWANDLDAPLGAAGSPTNQTEIGRYLMDIYGGYDPSADFVDGIYSNTWPETGHVQNEGAENVGSVINELFENTYGLLTGFNNGQRRLIDLRALAETTFSSVVRNFTGIEVANFTVVDTPSDKIYNSFRVNYCKNYVTDDNLFYCNAIVDPDFSSMTITTDQVGEDSAQFNLYSEKLAELCQYSANLYGFVNTLEIDVPALDFRAGGDAVTRFIYEIAKITSFRRREYSFSIAYDDYASGRVYVGDRIALTNFVRTGNNTVYGLVSHVGIDPYNNGSVEIQFSSLQVDKPTPTVLDEQAVFSVTIINEQEGSTTTIDEA